MSPRAAPRPARGRAGSRRTISPRWHLRLYVAGMTPRSAAAYANLKAICEERMAGAYEITVIDLLKQPRLAKDDEIIAVPTLVRLVPPPMRKVIGDLADRERTLVGLGLKLLR